MRVVCRWMLAWVVVLGAGACSPADPIIIDGSDGGLGPKPEPSCEVITCVDDNPCTTDECLEGVCQFPVRVDGVCDDGDACTSEDQCDGTGVCTGTSQVCDDANACTVDSCESTSGDCLFVKLPDGTPCGKSPDSCVELRCAAGVCASKKVSECSDACGDGQCEGDETCKTCSADCGACPVVCGDGQCEGDETCKTCSADCGACPVICGDGQCEGTETCKTCSADCGACPVICGDGQCEGTETCKTCSADCGTCPVICGDGQCHASETCGCSADCGAHCGNGTCDCGETAGTCAADCADPSSCVGQCGGKATGCYCQPDCLDFDDCCTDACTVCGICEPVCGDGTCEAAEACSCVVDCGPSCGNGTCDCGEAPGYCIKDCGDPNSCAGQCGAMAQDCSCEASCVQKGNCCLDACATCGLCTDVCGNGLCEGGEGCSCTSDCGPACGNNVCDCGETSETCPQDCVIANECEGICGGPAPSGCFCSADCVGFQDCCPDVCASCGICDVLPPDQSCQGKCGGKAKYCWCDEFCVKALDCCQDTCSECGTCAACGDGICDALENSCDCASDCGAPCGNGVCDCGENSTTCPGDCQNPNSCAGQCGGNAGNCWCDNNCYLSQDCCADACSTCGACSPCEVLVPGATDQKVFVVTPCRFDGNNLNDKLHFIALANAFADALVETEPFKSNLGSFSVKMSLDFSAHDVADGQCWYNPKVIDAGAGCGGMTHVLAIANNSGEAGGNWLDGTGMFSVAGSGVTIGCDPTTCTAAEGFTCPPAPPPHNCSWDAALPFSLLHEAGHTLGLGHSCGNDFDPPDYSGPNNTDNDINCALVSSNSETTPCPKWNHPEILAWQLPGDPPLGCYSGCGSGYANWYRPWKRGGIMCRDDFLAVGFTPISRKVIHDQLLGGCQALAGIPCGLNGWKTCFQKRYVLCVEDDEGI